MLEDRGVGRARFSVSPPLSVDIGRGELTLIGTPAGHAPRPARRREAQGLWHRVPGAEGEREPGGEAVASAVGVHQGAGQRDRVVGARGAVGGLILTPVHAVGPHDQARPWERTEGSNRSEGSRPLPTRASSATSAPASRLITRLVATRTRAARAARTAASSPA